MAQNTKAWMDRRRFRVTSSSVGKFLQPSACPAKILDSEPFGNPNSKEALVEILMVCFLCKIVFRTGFHVHPDHHWLGSSPDGIMIFQKMKIPVEIKLITSRKTDRQVCLEYYAQLQTHIEVGSSPYCLLVICRLSPFRIRFLIVYRDDSFVQALIRKARDKFLASIPRVIYPKIENLSPQNISEISTIFQKHIKGNSFENSENDSQRLILKKNLRFEDFKIATKATPPITGETCQEYLERTSKISEKLFHKKSFPEYVPFQRFLSPHHQVLGKSLIEELVAFGDSSRKN